MLLFNLNVTQVLVHSYIKMLKFMLITMSEYLVIFSQI